MKLKQLLLLLAFIAAAGTGYAQDPSLLGKRYEIDMKRMGLNPEDKEALFRSREFIRIDPTYYVGYYYEAIFKYERASDYLGYRNLIPLLKKAISLLEKDFSKELSMQYTSREEYSQLETVRMDYAILTQTLVACYNNLEHPDSTMLVLKNYQKWNFQYDILTSDTDIAWTFHRNRFFTSAKYPFLGNSIEENEKLALNHLYIAKSKIEETRSLNEAVVGRMRVLGGELSIAHYMSIIHTYLRQPDSAYYYYRQMSGYNIFPYNNYGIFCLVNGDFFDAENNFRYSQLYDYDDKRVRETDFYLGILAVYKAKPDESILSIKERIQNMGVIPGWGWTNLALARSYLYNGQLKKSMEHITKARNFKELHIGTTWVQSHYELTAAALELMNKDRQMATRKFENRGYWYSPSTLLKLSQLKVEKDAFQLLLVNRIAANPERNDLFYRIFSSESTVSFDETWFMLKDFGQKFFKKHFDQQAKEDERVKIRKYFLLFSAMISEERGRKKEALELLDRIERREPVDSEYEVLFEARMLETKAKCTGSKEDIYSFYEKFPQLVPFSDLAMSFRFEVFDNGQCKAMKAILNQMKQYNVGWAREAEKNAPHVLINFTNDGKNDLVTYTVKVGNRTFIPQQQVVCSSTAEDAAREVMYGLFKIIDPDQSKLAYTY